ncbi:alpha/beta hydrolase [Roseomonas hellenica]|nr:alpha/beta hydrolase [Plastoroseomonas hellenica]
MKGTWIAMTTTLVTAMSLAGSAGAQERIAPARRIPIPTDVSPQLQAMAANPPPADFNTWPTTVEGWVARQRASEASGARTAAEMAGRLNVAISSRVLGGVTVFDVVPQTVAPENRNRLLLHLHPGCYVVGGGSAATVEAVLMAGLGHFRVVSIDYRMPPTAYFPAALDDAVTVWKEALKSHDASQMAVFGSSAGGALTLAMVLRAKQLGLPLPAAIAPGTPMADLTGVGDSLATNALIDNVLVSREGFCEPAARFYANGHDLSDPLLSPVYGDFSGFPPAILTTGTRDLLLSGTARVHRRLRAAGVEAQLQVFEAMSHAQYLRDDQVPETREAFREISAFFDRHLAR